MSCAYNAKVLNQLKKSVCVFLDVPFSHHQKCNFLATFVLRRWNCLMRQGCYWCIWKLHRYSTVQICELANWMKWVYLFCFLKKVKTFSFFPIIFHLMIGTEKFLWNHSVVKIAFAKYFRTPLYCMQISVKLTDVVRNFEMH